MRATGHESCDVGDVEHHERTDFIRDGAERLGLETTRI